MTDETASLLNDSSQHRHDPIGAYLVGALPADERAEFEMHLRECALCQSAVREYGPIATLLPRLYDDLHLPGGTVEIDPATGVGKPIAAAATALDVEQESTALAADPPTIEEVDRTVEATVPDLANPVLPDIASPAVERMSETASPVEPASTEAETAPAESDAIRLKTRRPRGRIAPGEAPPEANVVSLPRGRGSIIPWAIAAASAILAIGTILWALAMMGQIDDLKAERDLQDQQIVQLNKERQAHLQQTAAVVHSLVSTTSGASGAIGTVYLDPDPAGTGGIISFQHMAQPPGGQVYQVWMITGGQLSPGPTFAPDANGNAVVQIGTSAATAEQLAVTLEPTGGSQTPTTSPVMQGSLSS